MSADRWTAALDELERALAEQRAALDAGEPEAVVAFAPPEGLGPLPAALVPRAGALLASAEELVAHVRALVATTQQELSLLARMRPATNGPSYVDHTM